MMPSTRMVLVALSIVACSASFASTSCLEHVGGGGHYDFECYTRLAADVDKKNAELLARIHGAANKYRTQIDSYFLNGNEEKYCYLRKMALYDWVEEKSNNVKYQDVAYAHCIYEEKLELSKKLEKLIAGSLAR